MRNQLIFKSRKINEENLGEFLTVRRKEIGLSLSEVSKSLSIGKDYLAALEENNFQSLPPDIYVKGFVSRYADFLNLDSKKAVLLYEKRKNVRIKDVSYSRPFGSHLQIFRFLNYRNFIFFLGFTISAILFFYILKIISPLYSKPSFKLAYPPNCPFETNEEKIELKGVVQPEGHLLINGEEILTDKEGLFVSPIILKTGENGIHFKIINKFKKEREESCVIRKAE